MDTFHNHRNHRGQKPRVSFRQAILTLSALVFFLTLTWWERASADHIPAAPVTMNNNATFQTSGQSMWGPASAPGVSNVTVPIISEGWNESDSKSALEHVHVDVPGVVTDLFGIGDVDEHFGGSIGGSTSGQIGISARFDVGSGSVGVTYPVQVTLTTPAANSFKPGQTVTIGSSVALLPGGNLSTTAPQGTVSILGTFGFATSATASVCIFDCSAPVNFFPPINIPASTGTIVSANSTDPRTITFLETLVHGISGTYGFPNVTTTATLAPDGKSLTATGSHNFVNLNVDLDRWVTYALGFPPLGFNTPSIAGAQAGYETLDFGVNLDLTQSQQFQFTPTVEISLALPQAVSWRVVGSGVWLTSSVITFDAGQSVEIVYPATASNIFNVAPTFSLRNTFSNNTTTTFAQSLQVEALKLSLSVPGVTVISEVCVPEIPIPGLDDAAHLADDAAHFFGDHAHPRHLHIPGFCFGPVNSPTVNLGTLGPVFTKTVPVFSATDSSLFDQNLSPWQLAGFNTSGGSAFVLDPQLPPTAVITGPSQVNEGQLVSFSGANSTDPDGDSLTYSWNFGDGATATGVNPTHIYADNSTYTVTLTVADGHGYEHTTTHTITINNVAPSLVARSNLTTDEGSVIDLTGTTFSDPGFGDTHTATVNWGDGPSQVATVTVTSSGGPGILRQGTVAATHVYADNGIYTVQVCVMDDDGGSGCSSFTATVNNVAPNLAVSGSTTVNEGGQMTLNLSAPDVGSADVMTLAASGLPPGASFIQTPGNPASGTLSWIPAYTQSGSYPGLTFTATDDDGGATSQTLTLTVNEAGQPVVAVTNSNDRSVSLIDAQIIQVVGTEAVGKKPVADSFFDIFFDVFAPPAKLYVAEREKKGHGDDDDDDDHHGKGHDDDDDGSKGTIRVLVGPGALTFGAAFDFATAKLIGVGNRPEGLAVNPAGTQVWVANRNDDTLSVIDRATDTVIATVPLKIMEPPKGKGKPKEKEIGKKPVAIGFSPDGKYAYVVGRNSDNLIVLDATTYAILASIKVGNKPVALAVSGDGSKVYLANRSGNTVAVVNTTTPTSPTLLTQVPVGEEPEGVALLNDGTKLYVTNSESNTVSVFEVLSVSPYLGLLKTVSVGMEPSGVAVTRPESFVDGDFVYVTNRDDNTVSVIDATNDTVIATIPVGKGPKGVTAGIIPTQ